MGLPVPDTWVPPHQAGTCTGLACRLTGSLPGSTPVRTALHTWKFRVRVYDEVWGADGESPGVPSLGVGKGSVRVCMCVVGYT